MGKIHFFTCCHAEHIMESLFCPERQSGNDQQVDSGMSDRATEGHDFLDGLGWIKKKEKNFSDG